MIKIFAYAFLVSYICINLFRCFMKFDIEDEAAVLAHGDVPLRGCRKGGGDLFAIGHTAAEGQQAGQQQGKQLKPS